MRSSRRRWPRARCRGGSRPRGWKRWRRGSGSSPAARRAPTTGSWARTAPAGSRGAALGLIPQGDSVGLGGSLSGLDWHRLVLAFPEIADSYLWIFPRPDGASVGIAYTPGRLTDGAARAALDGFLDRHLPVGWRDLPGPRYRYPIPVFGPWTLRAVRRGLGHRILLTGDAAALADPLTREGIRYGLLSGLWAAESLLAGRPMAYLERLDAELEGEMERAAKARDLFFEGSIGQWMVPVARLHPGIRRVLERSARLPAAVWGIARAAAAGGGGVGAPKGRNLNSLGRKPQVWSVQEH